MKCTCNDATHRLGEAVWHRTFRRWYDARQAGHRIRAAAWGFLADRVVRFA